MDDVVKLCQAIKTLLKQLKPQNKAFSFILLTGKANQGKSALLKQSQFQAFTVDDLYHAEIYYNHQGIILKLDENFLNQSKNLLAHTLKSLNRCHPCLKISGLILCIDISELLMIEPLHMAEKCKNHMQIAIRFAKSLGYTTNMALILTKLDTLAGFSEFFQNEHNTDLHKPLGFSLLSQQPNNQLLASFKHQFEGMLEVLGQQIISKLHPARSTIKRTHIREFPLQLANLRIPLQNLLQSIPSSLLHLQALYFTSAQQGDLSIDCLNTKIRHEYALTIQDKFPQSHNYRAFFITGALEAFQAQTLRQVREVLPLKWVIAVCALFIVLGVSWYLQDYFKTSQLLDEASKELLAYEHSLNQQQNQTAALYHLSSARTKLNLISHSLLSVSLVEQLKRKLNSETQNRIQQSFLPQLLNTLENHFGNFNQNPLARYQALKIYLMLGDKQHFSEKEITTWFNNYWQDEQLQKTNLAQLQSLLATSLKKPWQPLELNHQLINDTRNYLNALPAAYFYYSLAKNAFPKKTEKIQLPGFELASEELPYFYTKAGFREVIQLIPHLTQELHSEDWVLNKQEISDISALLQQAYCFDYVSWWQNFMRKTRPVHYQNYEQGRELSQTLAHTQALNHLIERVQKETSPELNNAPLFFNEKVASHFTPLNLISNSAIHDLVQSISEIDKFLTTLSLVHDEGKTAFELAKTRFEGHSQSDPLSLLYSQVKQLPDPIANWSKQIADDCWFIVLNESRAYLNRQWKEKVFPFYHQVIANRYPFSPQESQEINLNDFNQFFSPHGVLPVFVNTYLKPFLDMRNPEWQPKEMNGYMLPISTDLINELIRGNIISNMFYPDGSEKAKIDFSLQKLNLDPVVANLQLTIGNTTLSDSQESESLTQFIWPGTNAKLSLYSIEGNHYEFEELGPWAFFKLLQKVNVLTDTNDSNNLEILFEINGNSGRYLLRTQNKINPFTPGILSGFNLKEELA